MFKDFFKEHKRDILISYLVIGIPVAVFLIVFHFIFKVDDLASLGQLLLEFAVLPTALLAILFAADEFRKAQAAPDLDLRITELLAKEYSYDHAPEFNGDPEHGRYAAAFYVINEGSAIAQWFEVVMWFPMEILGVDHPKDMIKKWERVAAPNDENHWDEFGKIYDDKYHLRVHFKSNGEVGAFLEQELHLGWIHMIPYIDQDTTYEIPYKIVPTQGSADQRKLLVHFKTFDLGI